MSKPQLGLVKPVKSDDDSELVRRTQNGDRKAFRALVEKYQSTLAVTVRAMLGGTPEIDDVVQDVFIKFYQSADKFRGDASVKTYLKRMAVNKSLDVLRKRKNVFSRFLSRDNDDINLPEPPAASKSTLESSQRDAYVQAAIQRLPDKHRAVIVLRMIEGYSTQETADMLNVNYGTVLSRLSRAQQKLKTLLLPLYNDH